MSDRTAPALRLAVLHGDGIGPEIVPAALAVADAVHAVGLPPVGWLQLPFGVSAIGSHGTAVPQETLAGLADVDGWLLGPGTSAGRRRATTRTSRWTSSTWTPCAPASCAGPTSSTSPSRRTCSATSCPT
ncbi:isocitrate/isopropylmalate family dehydrogenase [Modestobacter sp. I12A-02662]|uniref:isocitrate/isopropylmalate family dehydrogenase n=1 Tax=Modestobacter sp. I12A-02662 TaxID=1730496 RepID=UPI0034DFBB3A